MINSNSVLSNQLKNSIESKMQFRVVFNSKKRLGEAEIYNIYKQDVIYMQMLNSSISALISEQELEEIISLNRNERKFNTEDLTFYSELTKLEFSTKYRLN